MSDNHLNTAKAVLEELKQRRLREEAWEILRARTKRNVPLAVGYFAFAGFWAWLAATHGLGQTSEGKRFLLLEGTGHAACALIFVAAGVQQLWVRPSDKLLLLLAEDSFAKKEPAPSLE